MTKKILTTIVTVIIIIATMVFTFWQIMNHLHITVNEEQSGALVECFGQVWYCDIETN